MSVCLKGVVKYHALGLDGFQVWAYPGGLRLNPSRWAVAPGPEELDTQNVGPRYPPLLTMPVSSTSSAPPLRSEVIAAVATKSGYEGALDLLMGVHPDELRDLSELEESAAHWVSLAMPDTSPDTHDQFSQALALWRRHFPNFRPPVDGRRGTLENSVARWKWLLPRCLPLAGAYLFRPTGVITGVDKERAEREYRETFAEVRRQACLNPFARGHVSWTTSLIPSKELRQVFEAVAGLTASAKTRLGLNHGRPHFLRRYAAAQEDAIEKALSPEQFEHLVAELYRADGWRCHVTPYSKDGGIDIEASRLVDGIPAVVLMQVKRNRSKLASEGRPHAVDLDDVKAFAATIRGEGRDAGVLVTTSHVTKDAKLWAATKGTRVATVSFLEGTELRDRLYELTHRFGQGDISSYVVPADIGGSG